MHKGQIVLVEENIAFVWPKFVSFKKVEYDNIHVCMDCGILLEIAFGNFGVHLITSLMRRMYGRSLTVT